MPPFAGEFAGPMMRGMTIRIELARTHRRRYEQSPWWVDKDQVRRVLGPPDPAALAQLVDDRGTPLAWGLYSPASPRPFRALRLANAGALAPMPEDWLEQALTRAFSARTSLLQESKSSAARMVNSEGDGLPGLTIDRYGDRDVVALSTAAMLSRQAQIRRYLEEHGAPLRTWIFPQAALEREGVSPIPEASHDSEPPELLSFIEDGLQMRAPAPPSQKTGAYLDQRDNRRRWAELLAPRGGVLLDVGSHVGGFCMQAARAGLSCIAVDQSARVLEYVNQNAKLNQLSERIETRCVDMFSSPSGWELPKQLDAVMFDPPKVARHPQERKKAMSAMTRTVAQLWSRLREGGYFGICSCSHHLGYEHLDRIMLDATLSRPALHVARWGPGVDHPVALCHASGHYLRVSIYRK